ncbi:hypothetical protein [Yinghuangia seranimata]|uniref:hypothetical protein n=1 Tax=Yinghuangia seranimata TaxID=408067 RepID=UPI00248C31B5|nr:hypothetical protein [Yinghuangia seranimata]MDI2126257.1 hypothetical protein [Yinghuangia seranimata]
MSDEQRTTETPGGEPERPHGRPAPGAEDQEAPGPRARPGVVLAAVFGLLLGGGAAAGVAAARWPEHEKPKPPPPPAAPAVPGMVEGDIAVGAAPQRSGNVELTVLTLRCGMSFITGTHAEHFAEQGQICRVGVQIRNDQTTSVNVDSTTQQLVLANGATAAPDNQSMLIRRQIGLQPVGAHNIVVLEYWYDIAADTQPTAIRLKGTADLPTVEVPLPAHQWKP